MIKIYDKDNVTNVDMKGDIKTILSELYYFKQHEHEIIEQVTKDAFDYIHNQVMKGQKHEYKKRK